MIITDLDTILQEIMKLSIEYDMNKPATMVGYFKRNETKPENLSLGVLPWFLQKFS